MSRGHGTREREILAALTHEGDPWDRWTTLEQIAGGSRWYRPAEPGERANRDSGQTRGFRGEAPHGYMFTPPRRRDPALVAQDRSTIESLRRAADRLAEQGLIETRTSSWDRSIFEGRPGRKILLMRASLTTEEAEADARHHEADRLDREARWQSYLDSENPAPAPAPSPTARLAKYMRENNITFGEERPWPIASF